MLGLIQKILLDLVEAIGGPQAAAEVKRRPAGRATNGSGSTGYQH